MPVGEGVWRVWRVFESFGGFAAWQTAALKANRKPLLWPWPWGACWGRCVEGLEGFGGFGGLWPWPGVPVGEGVWRVWRVWRVLKGFGRFWSVCGLANGSFESQ